MESPGVRLQRETAAERADRYPTTPINVKEVADFDERIGSISSAIRAATAGSCVPVVERSWALIPPGTSRPKVDDMIGQLIQWDRSPLIFFYAYLHSGSDMPPIRAEPA
jgi:hypothetical protein